MNTPTNSRSMSICPSWRLRLHLLAGAFALTFATVASASDWVEFQLCNHKSGKRIPAFGFDGFSTKARVLVYPEDVRVIVPLVGDKCTLIKTARGDYGAVVGGYEDVLCKLQETLCQPNKEEQK